jgi:hypothetical protein
MRTCLTSIGLFLILAATSRAGTIDFTPTEGTRTLEGAVFKQVRFHQDGHVITYEPPHDWTYSGDGNSLRLSPPHTSQAQVTVQQVALGAPQAFDEATTKLLQQVAVSALPPGATDVTLVEEEANPVQIHQQPTYGVTLGYKFLGQEYEANLLFANLGDTQLRCRVVARKANFAEVRQQFRGSLFSLAWE